MRRHVVLLLLPLAFCVVPAPAAAQQLGVGCDRERTTSIRFGRAGGELMPQATEITPQGVVRRRSNHEIGGTLGHVPADSVLALARDAWRGGFGGLPPAPRSDRPVTQPRPFIELHSACGMHHVEYDAGRESPLFRALYARLTRLTARAGRSRH